MSRLQQPEVSFDSTLVRRGSEAARLSELIDFVEDIERRPLQKLAADLPGFFDLSGRKYELVVQVLKRRLRKLNESDRKLFRSTATKVATHAGEPRLRQVTDLLDLLGA